MNYSLSREERERDYLLYAFRKVFRREPAYAVWEAKYDWMTWINDDLAKLHHLYVEGFYVLGVLSMDINTFLDLMIRDKLYSVFSKPRLDGFWYRFHGVDHRQPMKYVKKSHHEKKEKDSDEWKKHKLKDYRNQGKYHGSHKKFAKKTSNRCYRRWVKEQIHHERYEELSNRPRKDFFDPWDWD